jgi:hypothetical protein
MPFTVNDLQDLTRILIERPEWLSEVRRIVLTNELLAMPSLIQELAEIQQRAEVEQAEFRKRVEAELAELRRYVDKRFAELVEAQQRAEAEQAEFRKRVEAELAELRRYVDMRFAELAEAQQRIGIELAELRRRTDERFAQLAESQLRIQEQLIGIKDELADVRGRQLELDYRIKAVAFFGGWLRKPAVVEVSDIWDQLEAHLDEIEMRRLTAVDLIVRGQLPKKRGEAEVWLAVEVSNVVDLSDVERAVERAALLRRAGLLAIPVVGGKRLTRGAAASVAERRVVLSKGGELVGWDEVLDRILGAS